MADYIRSSKKLGGITALIERDEQYRQIRRRLNDYVHYNFFQYVVLNESEVLLDRISHLNSLTQDLSAIFILHFAYLFTLNGHYMMSSDHVDYLEVGQTPPEGSEYWVSQFVQDTFSNVLMKARSDIAAEIKRTTTMKLA